MSGRDILHDLHTIVVGKGANEGVLKLYIPQNYRNNSACVYGRHLKLAHIQEEKSDQFYATCKIFIIKIEILLFLT